MSSLTKNIKLALISIFIINVLIFFLFLYTNSYPFFTIILNILSIIFLWYIAAHDNFTKFNKKIITKDGIILLALFLLALSVYLYKIDIITPGIQGDEIAIAKESEQILTAPNFLPFISFNLGHPTPLLYLTGLSIKTFGRSLMAIRLPYVIFGALSISAFYILLRVFFIRSISVVAALLMLFSYPFIIVSRLAYEVTPEIFFQLVTAIFLYFAWKTKDIRYFIAIGVTLGLGLYTYVGFRTFFLMALLFTAYLISKTTRIRTEQLKLLFITLASLFIVCAPLLSYSVTHMQDIMARTTSLSPFNQGFTPTETVYELGANVGRLPRLFFMGNPDVGPNGDSSFLRNPSNVSMFDIGTFIFFVIGLIYLVKTNKKLFFVLLILAISPLVNDLLVIERIPQAMHPYGVGHPNTLRIAGLIPIIYFTVAYGLSRLKLILSKGEMNFYYVTYVFLACIMFYNWYLYYEQPVNKVYSFYIDNHNGVYVMDIVNLINKNDVREVAVSPQLLSDQRFSYFLKSGVKTKVFDPKNYPDAITLAQKNQVTIFYVLSNIQLAQQILSQGQVPGLQIEPITLLGNINTLYAIAFIKNP